MSDGGVAEVIVVGGTAAVSRAVEDQLAASGIGVTARLSGATRYETGVAVLDFAISNGADGSEMIVVTGNAFPDALGAGALGARTDRLVLLVDGGRSLEGQPAEGFIAGVDDLDLLVLLGGEGVLPQTLAAELAD